jgi:hypothetical protein
MFLTRYFGKVKCFSMLELGVVKAIVYCATQIVTDCLLTSWPLFVYSLRLLSVSVGLIDDLMTLE